MMVMWMVMMMLAILLSMAIPEISAAGFILLVGQQQ